VSRQIAAVIDGGQIRADDDSPVPWWSFGKTVLAAAALRLVAEGALALDEALPGEAYTLRQLLCHRGGLGDYGMLPEYHAAVARGDVPWSEAEMRDRTRRILGQPDRRFSYSNVGYTIVRRMIEDAAGAGLQASLDLLVFAPLGVGGVTVVTGAAALAATAWGNARGYDPGWVYHGLLAGSVGTAGLLLSRMLDPASGFLPAHLLNDMRTPQPVERPPDDRPWRLDEGTGGYGLGLMIGIGEPPIRFEGHTGGGPGSRIAVYRAADTGMTACVAADIEDEAIVERAAMRLAAAPGGLRPPASGGHRQDDAGSV
jgi:CubicO group peptidase (beta-lactamase class C family)